LIACLGGEGVTGYRAQAPGVALGLGGHIVAAGLVDVTFQAAAGGLGLQGVVAAAVLLNHGPGKAFASEVILGLVGFIVITELLNGRMGGAPELDDFSQVAISILDHPSFHETIGIHVIALSNGGGVPIAVLVDADLIITIILIGKGGVHEASLFHCGPVAFYPLQNQGVVGNATLEDGSFVEITNLMNRGFGEPTADQARAGLGDHGTAAIADLGDGGRVKAAEEDAGVKLQCVGGVVGAFLINVSIVVAPEQ